MCPAGFPAGVSLTNVTLLAEFLQGGGAVLGEYLKMIIFLRNNLKKICRLTKKHYLCNPIEEMVL